LAYIQKKTFCFSLFFSIAYQDTLMINHDKEVK